ncbi:MAG: glutamate synthase subunit beta [Mariprofundaceae bacterium]|nr:glutamate synthase subunit beta [Mariprofundaceae bacterium]
MGKPTGFKEFPRENLAYAPVADRLTHYQEFSVLPKDMATQGGRCMDCGIPFCHDACPIHNTIPDWNDLVYRDRWQEALDVLHATNNFPEFTGRICPAPCEEACTVTLIGDAVSIKNIEWAIAARGWQEGWITPQIAPHKTGKKIAIVGSGPAGLACAQQLARAGHNVVVFEKEDKIGGLMRYGIPNFKFDKNIIDRRLQQMRAEGVDFRTHAHIGSAAFPARQLLDDYDAIVLTGGAEDPRLLHHSVAGSTMNGVYAAMDFLRNNTKRLFNVKHQPFISAHGKHVVVIGGGDTGSDCIGTSNRHGAAKITQIEILPRPEDAPDPLKTWPNWPNKYRTSTSQEEGCERLFGIDTLEVCGHDGVLTHIRCERVTWQQNNGAWQKQSVPNSGFEIKADLVLLAMGFLHPVHQGMLDDLGVDYDKRGNVKANTASYQTSLGKKVFTAGDMRSGQSLVVRAINEGRQAAHAVDEYLMQRPSSLPKE